MTTSSARVTSPPTTLAPTSAALVGEAAGEVQRPLRPAGRPGAASPMVSEWARPPMALMSERFCAAARWPDVLGAGPVAAEVPALDHQVGRDDHVAVADAQHGGVVAGPDEHVLALRKSSASCDDQAELAGVGEGRVGRVGMAPSDQIGTSAVAIDTQTTR